jgi:hypothetical protein
MKNIFSLHSRDLTPRPEEESLFSALERGDSVMLSSKRRKGKTLFLKNALKKDYLYIDFYYYLRIEDFILDYAKILQEQFFPMDSIKSVGKNLNSLKQYFSFIDVNTSMNVDSEVQVKFSLLSNKKEYLKSCLKEVLSFPQKYYQQKNDQYVIVWDEVQAFFKENNHMKEIMEEITSHKNISYVLSGSDEELMRKIYDDIEYGLSEVCSYISLSDIEEEEWISFLKKMFKGMDYSDTLFKDILTISKGDPYYTNYLASKAVEMLQKGLNKGKYYFAKELVRIEETGFKQLIDGLTNNQKKCLAIIGKADGENIYNSTNLQKMGLSKSAMERCLTSFLNMNLLYRDKNRLLFSNPLLAFWIQQKF